MKIFLGIIVFIAVLIILMNVTAIQLLILWGIGAVIAFIVAGIQIFLDRKNLAELDEFDSKENE